MAYKERLREVRFDMRYFANFLNSEPQREDCISDGEYHHALKDWLDRVQNIAHRLNERIATTKYELNKELAPKVKRPQ